MQSWIQKRNKLLEMIKILSEENGGDDLLWLREYGREIVNSCIESTDVAIECFKSMLCTYVASSDNKSTTSMIDSFNVNSTYRLNIVQSTKSKSSYNFSKYKPWIC
jgi:hypothetical protein